MYIHTTRVSVLVQYRLALLVGASLFFFVGCGGHEYYKHTFFRMDTMVAATISAGTKKGAQEAFAAIDSMLADWEQRFSQTHSRSEPLAANQHAGDTVAISPLLGEMLEVSLAYGDTLEGGFDITILPIKELWGFGEQPPDSPAAPNQDQIQQALAAVDYRKVHLFEGGKLHVSDSAVRIDIGGVAKGFSLREMARILDARGIENFLLSAGGDIYSRGRREGGGLWRVGIQHPRDRDIILAVLALDSGAVVTSGDYERFWISPDSTRYHHLFNAKTGRPCNQNQSLTIWSPDPIAADILSTGVFCLPPKEVLAFVNARDNLECAGVDSSGAVYTSDNWSALSPRR